MLRPFQQFTKGLALPIRGGFFLLRHRRLWLLAATPFVLNVVLYAIGVTLFIDHYNELFGLIMDRPDTWYWTLVYYPMWAVTFLVALAIFIFSFVYVGTVIAAPFLDMLSERTEAILAGETIDQPFRVGQWLGDILRSAGHAIKTLGVLAVTFPLSFIPIIGHLAWLGLGCLLLAYDFSNFVTDRRRLAFRSKWRLLLRNFSSSLGFGITLFVFMAVPLLGLFILRLRPWPVPCCS